MNIKHVENAEKRCDIAYKFFNELANKSENTALVEAAVEAIVSTQDFMTVAVAQWREYVKASPHRMKIRVKLIGDKHE